MVVLAAAAGKLVGRRRFRWIRCVWGVSCRPCRAAVVNKLRAGAAADRGDRPADSPVRATGPGAWRRATGISKSGHGLLVAATRSGARAEGLLEWAFGAGSQGVTPVGLLGSRY